MEIRVELSFKAGTEEGIDVSTLYHPDPRRSLKCFINDVSLLEGHRLIDMENRAVEVIKRLPSLLREVSTMTE